jgi:uncharacterized protein YjbJ (UPF0337 family)
MRHPCRTYPARVAACMTGMRGCFAWNVLGHLDVDPVIPRTANYEDIMNKDRVEGSLEQAKGKMKEVAGKAVGDSKLETEGKAQQVAGKVQNAVGGFKDAVKDAVSH